MNIQQKLIDAATASRHLYIAPLDGLRFLAFLAVFFHHMPQFTPSLFLTTAHNYGWVGVELFFLISSFLFFHLLDAEYERAGSINIRNFYVRRLLRIYPLMIAFAVTMLAIYGNPDGNGYLRLAGLALFLDNAITCFRGYNLSSPTSHLWTLSFEFQIYLLIPFVFLAYRRFGKGAFLAGLVGVLVYCFLARMLFFALDVKHPVVWVTPFLRPESVLAGMALYVIRPRWHWGFSLVGSAVAATLFLCLTDPWKSALGSAFSYPLAAVAFAGLVDSGLRAPWLASILSTWPMRYLGRISYGLYVFHYVLIVCSVRRATMMQGHAIDPANSAGDYWLLWLVALTLTIAAASVSYYAFEKWIARFKRRFESQWNAINLTPASARPAQVDPPDLRTAARYIRIAALNFSQVSNQSGSLSRTGGKPNSAK
ncbi:acyltransferase family protein [Mesorhizobium sp. CA4]|uniref:acyltransferase family protein n=1 Tax=Mesorhizobium sp. CA4 TaxID=588499 RepID=UPI001CD1869B|nr:acyltransferase [Mesorhizobium sp. CA4]MBZ9821640.1 acyltransferase [Mesorhizobium sp. CA4]